VTCPVTPLGYPSFMLKDIAIPSAQVEEKEWVGFPGGELEGQPPRALCPACRARVSNASQGLQPRPLCFQCYRLALDRDRALRSAGQISTASEERFQTSLPFEVVDSARLERLRGERSAARAALQQTSSGRFEDRRRRAQMEARRALQRISAAFAVRNVNGQFVTSADERRQRLAAAAHAAELQLPESWLPFVMAR
jgi:hypothetical protein